MAINTTTTKRKPRRKQLANKNINTNTSVINNNDNEPNKNQTKANILDEISFVDDKGNFNMLDKSSIQTTASGRQIMYLTDRDKIAKKAQLLAEMVPFRIPES